MRLASNRIGNFHGLSINCQKVYAPKYEIQNRSILVPELYLVWHEWIDLLSLTHAPPCPDQCCWLDNVVNNYNAIALLFVWNRCWWETLPYAVIFLLLTGVAFLSVDSTQVLCAHAWKQMKTRKKTLQDLQSFPFHLPHRNFTPSNHSSSPLLKIYIIDMKWLQTCTHQCQPFTSLPLEHVDKLCWH